METVTNNCEHFINLCQRGNESAIHSFLGKDICVNDSDENGVSLLHVALSTGAGNILSSLLLKGAYVDGCTNTGWTPLMCAARSGQLKLVKQLVEHGAEVSHRNKLGIGILSAAAASGNNEVIKILLKVLQRNSLLQDDIACSLRIAALHGHSNVLQLLLDSHTHLINASDEHGITPLMLASAGGHEKAAKTLLDFGANSDLKNVQYFTAFDIASAKGYKKLVGLLRGKTRTIDVHHNDDCMHSNIGFDLVECYGWSSICTPKLSERIQHDNFLNSPSQKALKNHISSSIENNSLGSEILLQETDDNSHFISSLFSPVYQSLCNNVSDNTQKLENNLSTEMKSSPPITTFSACDYSTHSSIPQTFSFGKHCTNKSCESVANNWTAPICSESVKQGTQKESNEKIWIGGKVEKWLHSFLALWQKKVKANKSKRQHSGKLYTQSESFQNTTNFHEINRPYQFQKKKETNTNMSDNLMTSSNSSTLNNLLINLDLKSYVSLFQQHEIDMDSFLMLSQEDLEDIGITSPRCKNKLLKVIKAFKGEN